MSGIHTNDDRKNDLKLVLQDNKTSIGRLFRGTTVYDHFLKGEERAMTPKAITLLSPYGIDNWDDVHRLAQEIRDKRKAGHTNEDRKNDLILVLQEKETNIDRVFGPTTTMRSHFLSGEECAMTPKAIKLLSPYGINSWDDVHRLAQEIRETLSIKPEQITDENKPHIGQALRVARIRKNLKQNDIPELQVMTVSRFECGDFTHFSLVLLNKLAVTVGLDTPEKFSAALEEAKTTFAGLDLKVLKIQLGAEKKCRS